VNAAAFDPRVLDALGIPVRSLALDSRRVRPGDVFLAVPGHTGDGRDHIEAALAAGAAAVLWEDDGRFGWRADWPVPNAGIAGLRHRIGALAARVYGDPTARLHVIGVTGTNGKTSCAYWIAQALTGLGRPSALIGTLGIGYPPALEAHVNTTPDAVTVQSCCARFAADGAHSVALEASSIALDQGRLDGVRFAVAVYTNLTREHLDYHGTMQAYGESKARLFAWPGLRHAVLNVDDAFGRELAARIDRARVDTIEYGLGGGALAAHDLRLSERGLRLEIRSRWGSGVLESRMLGRHNASNLLATLGALLASGVGFGEALEALARIEPAPGRLERLGGGAAPDVVIDYAHTPDALASALAALRPAVAAGGALVCVFGCGGERDPGKRPLMGEIATRLADAAVITSDNPRGEAPQAIIDAIAAGAQPGRYRVEPDRRRAIAEAIGAARPGDVVLIAGKGHERYQEIAGLRHPFSDRDEAQQALARRAPGAAGARP
jgi:UDP-N-acetylmuramoyl-L-alanyl-D-glutamate--2,6-diaminopimelate ligase